MREKLPLGGGLGAIPEGGDVRIEETGLESRKCFFAKDLDWILCILLKNTAVSSMKILYSKGEEKGVVNLQARTG